MSLVEPAGFDRAKVTFEFLPDGDYVVGLVRTGLNGLELWLDMAGLYALDKAFPLFDEDAPEPYRLTYEIRRDGSHVHRDPHTGPPVELERADADGMTVWRMDGWPFALV